MARPISAEAEEDLKEMDLLLRMDRKKIQAHIKPKYYMSNHVYWPGDLPADDKKTVTSLPMPPVVGE